MYNLYIPTLCSLLNLGSINGPIIPVYGGLLNAMWHVVTDSREYAIKELNPTVMARPDALNNYEISEKIAKIFFDAGIPALTCITYKNNAVIKLDEKYFIVYPWIEGSVLKPNDLSKEHGEKIGAILAKMHRLAICVPELNKLQFNDLLANMHTDDYCSNLLDAACKTTLSFANDVSGLRNQIIILYQTYKESIHLLNNTVVISHGDLDPRNVLWTHNNNPIIIDWEAARTINPTQEALSVALDWSGLQVGVINFETFNALLKAYENAGGILDKNSSELAFDCLIGNWLNWLFYNIERSFNTTIHEDERSLGIDEVQKSLNILKFLVDNKKRIIEAL